MRKGLGLHVGVSANGRAHCVFSLQVPYEASTQGHAFGNTQLLQPGRWNVAFHEWCAEAGDLVAGLGQEVLRRGDRDA